MIQFRTTERFEFIHSKDSAIDKEHPSFNWERFMETADKACLPLKSGIEPTVFEVKRLTRDQYLKILEGPKERALEAVAVGLKSVRNATTEDGAEVKLTFSGERLDDRTLNLIFACRLMGELGSFIMGLSEVVTDPR